MSDPSLHAPPVVVCIRAQSRQRFLGLLITGGLMVFAVHYSALAQWSAALVAIVMLWLFSTWYLLRRDALVRGLQDEQQGWLLYLANGRRVMADVCRGWIGPGVVVLIFRLATGQYRTVCLIGLNAEARQARLLLRGVARRRREHGIERLRQ